MNNSTTTSLVDLLAQRLTLRGETFSVAESCTGGMIASLCTQRAGASKWFAGGLVAYSERIKHELLGVPMALIESKGVVSAEVAEQMVLGARKIFHADLSLATTGIAGPSGAIPLYPVGSMWIALSYRDRLWSKFLFFKGGRESFIERASQEVLRQAYSFIQKG
ncbi:CinA family protein [Porphyromonas circumdentaria]|uniref:Nicotinamide-nucleotide amidase n=1 Tax=Porphyromonas circumdentaria TaxID=29524 RepID=A0A1T4PPF2_9PORP|nr:CinA family protein [Porphyromonas circumdentaria]MBB6276443.1 PncC family amidohydrolase [Porphyromonas circumdentaria]MDO4723117.1 CinA family protein [Porphyromonas circumdentaria]SJZ93412.1 nicotinamide-nucleotide amidase [Porphyromonas circumdentaria]